jgi:hypothetical protein
MKCKLKVQKYKNEFGRWSVSVEPPYNTEIEYEDGLHPGFGNMEDFYKYLCQELKNELNEKLQSYDCWECGCTQTYKFSVCPECHVRQNIF